MNLGDAHLQTVNSNRPELVHSNSKQSITASDDYYSLSSGDSSQNDRSSARHYQTPPLHTKNGAAHKELSHGESTEPTVRIVRQSPPTSGEKSALATFDHSHKIKRKPVLPEGTALLGKPLSNEAVSPPTPGTDDTPFIQFALDQLTRDEEVNDAMRSRTHGAPLSEDYPVDRIFPDEQLRLQQGFQPKRHRRRSSESRRRLSESSLTALPATPILDALRFPKLDYRPKPLRLPSLIALTTCCLLMATALIFSNLWSSRHHGLWAYDNVGTSRYFVFEYLPQLLAIVIIFWLFAIQNALHRVLPFSMMHSERRASTSNILQTAALFPTNYMIPYLWCFRHGENLLGACFVVFWLSLFTVPLQSCLYQTRYFTGNGESVWRWTSVEPVGWTLLALYLVLAAALLLLIFKLRFEPSGLRWDPRSLADILVIFQRSNILSDFYGSEAKNGNFLGALPKKYTLRYWIAGRRSTDIFYGVEESQASLHGFPSNRGGKSNTVPQAMHSQSAQMDLENQRPLKSSTLDSLQKDIHSPFIRYRWLPWFLKDTFVVAWIVIAVVLTLAFVTVSFVNSAVQRGFFALLPAPTTSQGFSPADFLYSFIPSLIGMILFLLWQPIDMYFRALEPFANLGGSTHGCKAENCLLLDYTACLPVEVTIKAIYARHYKVAWVSFISLMSATLPTIGGGIFTAQFFIPSQQVRVAASMPGYYALVVFLIIYGLSFLTIWPTKKRRLPHDINTLGQILSFVYESHLLNDATFWQPRSKIDLVTRLLGNLTGDRGSSRYAFGVYIGRDGREHLGIDRFVRPESGEMFITTGSMK